MILRTLLELIPEVWEAYRPWLPLRTVDDFLTGAGHPGDALLGGGHWTVLPFVAVAAAVLVGVSNGRRVRIVAVTLNHLTGPPQLMWSGRSKAGSSGAYPSISTSGIASHISLRVRARFSGGISGRF